LNSRGSALAKLNQFDEAQKSYRLALDAAPENPAILLNLGLALEALGELSAAEDVLATAQALSPGTPDAPFARGLVRIRSGDIAGGFALYEHRWNQRGGPAQRHWATGASWSTPNRGSATPSSFAVSPPWPRPPRG
jgi:tetratricopeptide (TPR) repeat protein